MIDRSLICSFLVKMWVCFQLYLEYWMMLNDSILRNMLCSRRIVAVDIALWWTIRFWLQNTHSTFFCAPSGKQPFPSYGSQVSLCVMRIMIVMPGFSTQVCNFYLGGPQFRFSTCTLKMKIVTLSWDSICNLPWPTCGAFECLTFCSGSDLPFFSLRGRALSPEPHLVDCSFVLVPIELFHSTNITTVLYWSGPTWKCPKGSGWMGICRQKHLPGKSQAGQTNILTPVKSRLSRKHSVRWIARAKE